jgi:hypothetical protein
MVHAKEGARINRVRVSKLKTPPKEPTPLKESSPREAKSQERKA